MFKTKLIHKNNFSGEMEPETLWSRVTHMPLALSHMTFLVA